MSNQNTILPNTILFVNKYFSLHQESLLFLALGILLRLLFASKILHEWDSVQFALALEEFNLHEHQPHPPGMFIFYLFFGRIINIFVQDANRSLVLVSIISSGLAAYLIFHLATLWFNRQVGRLVALLMLTSPLVWFQGEVALSYQLEFFWTLLIVTGCFYLRSGNNLAFFLTPLLLGLAGGIRPNTLFFLLPIWLYSLLMRRKNKQNKFSDYVLILLIMFLGIISWLIPLFYLSGGINSYWLAMQPWLEKHPQDGVGRSFHGIYLNLKMLVEACLYGLGFAFFPAVWYLWKNRGNWLYQLNHSWQVQTLLVWIVPGMLYLTLVHIQRLGHTFTIMPALIILGGALLHYSSLNLPRKQILFVLIFLGNLLFFVFGPGNLDNTPTWATIREYDNYVQERVTIIKQFFPPQKTMVLTEGRNGRVREFYLPEYSGSSRKFELKEQKFVLPENIHYLVLFNRKIITNSAEFQSVKLPTSGELLFFHWGDNQRVEVSKESIKIIPE